jgi:hypothetical protein
MTERKKEQKASIAIELAKIYDDEGGLMPESVVLWAQKNPTSALYTRFEWDDSKAAHAHRLWQARQLIVEVSVIYADGKRRQVYVSPMESRGEEGYLKLVEVLDDAERRALFLAQALAELERLSEKYRDLQELAGVREAVKEASDKAKRRRGVRAA